MNLFRRIKEWLFGKPYDFQAELDRLVRGLSASDYENSPSILGQKLEVEKFDISGMGLYYEKDPSVPDTDYIPSGWYNEGRIVWMRKSEEGKKWHSYEDREIKDWSKLGKDK